MNPALSRRRFLGAASTLAAWPAPAAASLESMFAPAARLWARWTAHDAGSNERVDHAPWDSFLARHVAPGADGINRITYAALPAEDRAAITAYLDGLGEVAVGRLGRDEQFAYWANLYNALTVRLVVERWPVGSIRDIDISPGLFADGPWDKKLIRIEGEEISLNDIEHRILRPIWKDPRVHYAVNCASLGCPNLDRHAVTADGLSGVLDRLAREYVNHPRGWTIDGARLTVSSLYDWYKEDFGGSAQGVIAHLSAHSTPERAMLLRGRTRIDRYRYDWAINAA